MIAKLVNEAIDGVPDVDKDAGTAARDPQGG
jgi:hypothetical protein